MILFLLTVLVTTSFGAYWAGTLWLGYSRHMFRPALRRTIQTIGLALLFFVINEAITILVVVVLRAFVRFASFAVASDPVLLILSSVQALVFQFWRYAGKDGKE